MTAIPADDRPVAAVRRAFVLLVAALLATAIVVRGLPQLLGPERYLQHFASEDGYLMLTIARNLAAGLGMSTAAGTMPTNGTQPATTFVWAAGFVATGGDRAAGVWIALMLQFAAAIASTWLLYTLVRRLLGGAAHGNAVAWLAAAAWGASQRTCQHVMNCLETGFYTLALLLFARAFFAGGDPLRPWPARRAVGLGLLLGLVFWVRIDAVFLIGAVCLVRWLFVAELRFAPNAAGLRAALLTGGCAVAVASPWLIHNKVVFGRFTPVSGISQSHHAALGSNLDHVARVLTEYALVVVPFPQSVLERGWFVAATAVVAALAVLACVVVFRRGSAAVRTALLVFGGFGACLAGYYGLFFGAGHFVSRYLFPTSLVLAPVTVGVLVALWTRLPARTRVPAFAAFALGLLALVGATQWRAFQQMARHQHWQVVEFVRDHPVPETTWVMAVQTGTLGFFHDRTINLDGKVNPAALRALLQSDEAFHEYIAGNEAEYLIDWYGMADFVRDHPQQYAGRMEVLVRDPERNLGVLRRVR